MKIAHKSTYPVIKEYLLHDTLPKNKKEHLDSRACPLADPGQTH